MIIKHIYWFAPYNLNGASTRYRGYYPLKLLKNKFKIDNDFIYPSKRLPDIFKFIKIYLSALLFRKKDSIIVIQKVCSNRIYAKLLKLLVLFRAKNTLFDLDDAEYLRQDPVSLHFFLKRCNAVSAGSEELVKYCKAFNHNVYLLTSPVKDHNYVKKIRNKVFHIGWVGDFGDGNKVSRNFSHKTAMYSIFFPVLKLINKPLKLTLIGVKTKSDIPEIHDYFKDSPNIEINIVDNRKWTNDDWVYKEIEQFDAGVSPMVDHLFNRSKSAFKVKQYLSAGVPAIASNVGENSKFVIHNVNGYLCESKEDFWKAINDLITMSDDKYYELSKNALRSKDKFSMNHFCQSLIDIYQ